MNIIANMGFNCNSNREVIEMLNYCEDLNIKFVKFQLFNKKKLIPKDLHNCFCDIERAEKFYNAGKKRNIEVFFSVMNPESIDICESIGVKYYKIEYLDRNNLILYRRLKRIENVKDKIIFVSCEDTKDTIFRNMAKYQGNIRFLYCSPKLPALFGDYFKPNLYHKDIAGVIDNTPDFDLFEDSKMLKEWFEIHICLSKDKVKELDWRKSFEELKEMLNERSGL